jgi:hypothetical protein
MHIQRRSFFPCEPCLASAGHAQTQNVYVKQMPEHHPLPLPAAAVSGYRHPPLPPASKTTGETPTWCTTVGSYYYLVLLRESLPRPVAVDVRKNAGLLRMCELYPATSCGMKLIRTTRPPVNWYVKGSHQGPLARSSC